MLLRRGVTLGKMVTNTFNNRNFMLAMRRLNMDLGRLGSFLLRGGVGV